MDSDIGNGNRKDALAVAYTFTLECKMHQKSLIYQHVTKTLTFGLTAATLVFLAWMPTSVIAQEQAERPDLPSMQLQRFRPGISPSDYINVMGTTVTRHLDWNVGGYLDYADDPMQISTSGAPNRRTVDYQLHLGLLASMGFLDTFEVGLWMPMTITQGTEELQPLLPAGSASSRDLTATALGDWRLTSKFKLMDLAEHPLGLAFIAALSLPVGDGNAFGSDDGVGAEGIIAADYILFKGIRAGLNLGYRHRSGQRVLRENVIGNEVSWGVGFQVPLFGENLDAILEAVGVVGIATKHTGAAGIQDREVPVEVLGATRFEVVPGWTMTTGMGAGLTKGIGAPNFRAFVGVGHHWVTGGWWNVDYTSPGFRAPMHPCREVSHGPEVELDADGCPVVVLTRRVPDDKEIDEILNVAPQPVAKRPPVVKPEPKVPEPPERIVVTARNIVITEQVNFALGKDEILAESFPVLNDIADVLDKNPQILLLRIEGHTDSRGRDQANLDLSQRRAKSVMNYLVKQGISSGRLESIGFGRMRPIADNDTEEGRAANRRVDFTILKTAQ